MFVFHQLGISLVYRLNLFKTHCVLFANICAARGGAKLYSIVYRVLGCSSSGAHFYLCVFENVPLAMCATAQDAHIGIGQSCINSLLDFPILMKG